MSIRLTSLLKSVSIFKPPDGSCLSPAGEYNLRLGIMKELHPEVRACLQASLFFGPQPDHHPNRTSPVTHSLTHPPACPLARHPFSCI